MYVLTEPVPVSDQRVDNPFAIERPHAPADLLYRQCSFRGFDKLAASGSSPFKRHLSLPFGTARQTVVTSQLRSLHDKPSEFCVVSVSIGLNVTVISIAVVMAKSLREFTQLVLCQVTANPQTNSADFYCESACIVYSHYRHLLSLLSPQN